MGAAGRIRGLLAVVGLAALELGLPRLAARRVERELGGLGVRARVRALPALKLLAGRADSVEIVMDELTAGSGDGDAGGLERARGVRRLDVRAGRLRAGPLVLHEVRLRKDGDALSLEARLSEAELSAALPSAGVGLRPVALPGGGLGLEARAQVFGFRARAGGRLEAREGRVVIVGEGPLAALGPLPVFSRPGIRVTRVSARGLPLGGFRVVAAARLERP